ncbi:MAG: hypothetical protein HYZ47_03640 [Simkania negevensis]|nr:hypothetical protein [Simkania negevensis]
MEFVKRRKWVAITEKHLQHTRVVMTFATFASIVADYWKKTQLAKIAR